MSWIANSLGAATGLGIAGVLALVWPEPPFLTVDSLRVSGSDVLVARTIPGPKGIADWRVTIVRNGKAEPVCQTIPGTMLHEGWSVYEPTMSKERAIAMDVWVGDPGCYDRMTPGEFDMFTTWTPRDGRSPVAHYYHFEK